MRRGVILGDTSRHGINHDLAPFDIQAGRDLWVIWQAWDIVEVRREEVVKREESIVHDVWSGKNDQVPLGRPLRSGNLNIGVDRIGRESGVADIDQDRGSKSHGGPQG